MTNQFFYVLAGIVLGSAFLVVTLRNLFHCALFLALAMLGIAGIFLYMDVEFLAGVQVLIYVGAVTILVIFGIMLTRNVMDDDAKVMNKQVFFAFFVALGVILLALSVVGKSPMSFSDHPAAAVASAVQASPAAKPMDTYLLGPELIRPERGFAFSFEFVSVLLLSALVGAIVVARKDPA